MGSFLDCVCDSVSRYSTFPRLGCFGEHLWVLWEGIWPPPSQVPPVLGPAIPCCLGDLGNEG